MRTLLISLLCAGCTVGDRELTPTPDLQSAEPDQVSRFAPGPSVLDPGYGVLPDPELEDTQVPRLWASMGDRLCAVEGRNGTIEEDVFIDDETPPGLVGIDASDEGFLVVIGGVVHAVDRFGGTQGTVVPGGPVAGGLRTEAGGIALLVDTEAGCSLERDGTSLAFADACRADADLEELAGTLYVSSDAGIWSATADEIAPFASGDQVSVDPASASVWTGQRGTSIVQGHRAGVTVDVDLGGPLVDLAARQGQVIVLTAGEAPELLRLDAADGSILDRQAYVGRLDRDRLLLGDNGQGVVLTGGGYAQFYRVRTDAQVGL